MTRGVLLSSTNQLTSASNQNLHNLHHNQPSINQSINQFTTPAMDNHFELFVHQSHHPMTPVHEVFTPSPASHPPPSGQMQGGGGASPGSLSSSTTSSSNNPNANPLGQVALPKKFFGSSRTEPLPNIEEYDASGRGSQGAMRTPQTPRGRGFFSRIVGGRGGGDGMGGPGNGSLSSPQTSQSFESSTYGSDISLSSSDRRALFVTRSSVVCSAGGDMYNYDSDHYGTPIGNRSTASSGGSRSGATTGYDSRPVSGMSGDLSAADLSRDVTLRRANLLASHRHHSRSISELSSVTGYSEPQSEYGNTTAHSVSGVGTRSVTGSELGGGAGSAPTPGMDQHYATVTGLPSYLALAASAGNAGGGGSSPSGSGSSPVVTTVKRDSIVNRSDVQGSVRINGRFQNPWPTWRPPSFTNILKWGLARDKSNIPSKQDLDLALPIVKPIFSKVPPRDGVRITWIGHSTVVVQMDGVTFITDPIFSERASPSQMVGPKRYRDCPISVNELPVLDAVIISHTHYDHLDLNTVTSLNNRFGTDLRWYVPLGLAGWMSSVGVDNVVELDWWEESFLTPNISTHSPEVVAEDQRSGSADSDVTFVFTPAQHWSKRTVSDDNKVLWGSWAVIGPRHRFFFAGDTGFCPVFKQIGAQFGPFDCAAIPIGAYEPRWFMKYQHVAPEEAVQIHQDVQARFSMAVHWGTFALANEYYLDPPMKLRQALEEQSIPTESFITFKHGETRHVSGGSSEVVRPPRTRRKTPKLTKQPSSPTTPTVT